MLPIPLGALYISARFLLRALREKHGDRSDGDLAEKIEMKRL